VKAKQIRDAEPLYVGRVDRLSTDELLAIARRSPADPSRCSLLERLAWRELAQRGDPAFRRRRTAS
jgi:hypothetical protein